MGDMFTDKLRLLTALGGGDLEALESILPDVRVVDARSDIIKEGQRSEHLHIVLDGWASRYRLLADGRRQFPALVLPGDTCDLDRLQMDRLEFGVLALTSCKVALLPRDRVRALLDERPPVSDVFWWLTCVENAIASEWAVCLGRRSSLERVAHLFCELNVRLGAIRAARENSYLLPLTQQDLADALGLSVVHVNRTLQTLRSDGLISLRERRLKILDPKALARLCDFKPNYLHLEGLRRRPAPARAAG